MSWSNWLVTHRARRVPEDRRAGRTAPWARHRGEHDPLPPESGPAAACEKTAMRPRLLGAGIAAVMLCALITAAGPAAASMPAKAPGPPGFRAALEQIVDDGVPGA